MSPMRGTFTTSAVRFDTADRRLRRHALSLTRHPGGWTLATPDGEVHVPPTPGLDEVPHDLRWLVRAFTRGDDLVQVPHIAEPSPVTVPPDPSARGVVLAYLRTQIEEVAVADLAVRRDERRAAPRMRTAVCRLHDTLETYSAILGGRKEVRGFVTELRWLTSGLDAACDIAAQWDRAHNHLAGLPRRFVTGDAELRIDQYFGCLTEEAGSTVFETLDSERYLWLLNALDVLETVLREESRSVWPKAAKRPAGKVLPSLIGEVVRLVDRRVEAAVAGSAPVDRVGKAVDRLRHAIEAAAPIAPSGVGLELDRLRPLRKSLGEHREAVIAREHLRVLRRVAAEAGEAEFTYERLERRETATADSAARDLAGAWRGYRAQHSPLWT